MGCSSMVQDSREHTRIVGLIEIKKVKCASFCLAGDARMWWERIRMKRDVNKMNWADFETEFFEKFFHMKVTTGITISLQSSDRETYLLRKP